MGTYAQHYFGCRLIPEKQDEYAERVQMLFNQGGLMGLEFCPLTAYEWVPLLRPYPKRGDKFDYCYSYFEKSPWENAYFYPETGDFLTDKVGYSIFGQVCFAVLLLREFYEEVPGIASLSGTSPFVEELIGWFNCLFGESWDNNRVYRIQELYRRFPNWFNDYFKGRDRSPSIGEYRAFASNLPQESLKLDLKIYSKMADDQVCSDTASPKFGNDIRPVSTLDMLNLASEDSRDCGFEPSPNPLTEDDRAFWWTPEWKESFSQDMQDWLRLIHQQFCLNLQNTKRAAIPSTMFRILRKANEEFRRPVLFSSVFNDHIIHRSDRNIIAATRLLEAIVDKAIKDKDRTELDRYCALLANRSLRKEVLQFDTGPVDENIVVKFK